MSFQVKNHQDAVVELADVPDHHTLMKRCVELEDEIERREQQRQVLCSDKDRLIDMCIQHTTQINTLLADLSKLHSILSDPESVFINMKTGRIAKPSLRSILELYDPHEFNHSENPSLTQRQ